ncbi:MAG TPA: hypothetical protein DCG12_09185 [Planctomycetaceae bacterium]|nr:hypothetical protein [Planctomycetaceae bacterium]
MNNSVRQSERRGFTLVELLMVIMIIAFLAGLTVVAMSGFTDDAQVVATKATILKISRLIDERSEAFERSFRGDQRDRYISATLDVLSNEGLQVGYFRNREGEVAPAIRYLAFKYGFRFQFPQRMPELGAVNSDGVPLLFYRRIAYPQARQQLIEEKTSPSDPDPTDAEINQRVSDNWAIHVAHETDAQASDLDTIHSTESAELLYYMLIKGDTLGAATSAESEFQSAEIADTDGDSFPEFVDGWGQPLQFYRWPTRLMDPDAPYPFAPVFSDGSDPTETRVVNDSEREHASLLFKGLPPDPATTGSRAQRDLMLVDPDDPVGILYTLLENDYYKNQGLDLTLVYNEAQFHTPDTYHTPLVVSAGPDETLGLREPNRTDAGSGIFGNLGQYAGTTVNSPQPGSDVVEALFDNVTNRNRRAGAKR